MADKNLNINIIAKDKSQKALNRVQSRLGAVKKSVFSLKGALISIGAGAVIKSFVDVGREVESLGVRFKFLFGSVEEGSRAFNNLTKFAGRVPFSLEAISRASGNLAVVSKDAEDLNRILEITGNVAAVTGLDFETAASQIQRSFAGGIASADIFREKGVRSLLGFKEGAKVSVEQTVAAFEAAFSGNGRFANATKDLAQTLDGTLSMIGDKYFNFQKTVAEGFFDELKKEFGDLNKFLETNEQSIKDIADSIGKNFAGALLTTSDALKGIAPTVKTIANASGSMINGFTSLPAFVQSVGLIGALLLGKKGAVGLAGVSFVIGKINEIIDKAVSKNELRLLDTESLVLSMNSIEDINDALLVLEERTLRLGRGTTVINKGFEEQTEALKNLKKVFVLQNEQMLRAATEREIYNKAQAETIELTKKEISFMDELARRHGTESHLRAIAKGERAAETKSEQDELQRRRTTDIQVRTAGIHKKIELEKKGNEELLKNTKTALGAMAQTNKKAFEAYKAYQIAEATINAFSSASSAFKTYAGLFPLNIGIAAAALAAGMAQVSAIKSQTFSGRRTGGQVTGGTPYMVGEQGQEMFVPNQSGTIIPNDKLGGGQNINITINANDTQGFDELLVKRRATIVNVINDALNSQGKEALV